MRLLIFGDTHIPERARRIPEKFGGILKDFDMVVITGDLTSEAVLRFAEKLSEKVVAVRGNMDSLPLPNSAKFEVNNINFGVIHGHQVHPRGDKGQLQKIAKEMGVNVLISGHTHLPDVFQAEVILLNPGSITGVWGGGALKTHPSFMILQIREGKILGELYRLFADVDVERFELRV